MPITVGVIGCGNITKFHFDGLERAGARVKWVCDLNEESARPWAAKFAASYTADYLEVIRDDEVQAVWVTPISRAHREICVAAIDAGKAVICEKTLAENPDDALAIVQAAEARGTCFYTSYMKRFIPAVQKAKALLPELGQIMTSTFRVHQPWGDLWCDNPAAGFAHTPPGGTSEVVKRYGGGILVCGGSRILDLVGFLMGRPQRLAATMYVPDDRDYDLRATAIMETQLGSVLFEALSHPLGAIGFLRDGWDEWIQISGTNGRLDIYSSLWDNPTNKASLLVHYDNATRTSTEHRFDAVSPFALAVAHFCEQIEKGEQGPQSRVTGYDVDELIAHIKKSAATGEMVTVNYRIGDAYGVTRDDDPTE